MGTRKSFQLGTSKRYTLPCYGYIRNESGGLGPDTETAPVVQLIFRLALEGQSSGKIAKELLQHQILSPRGNILWHRSTMDKMPVNEKYVGNVLLQKTFVANYLDRKQARNIGPLQQFFAEDSHPAIISKEDFDAVQERLHRFQTNET